MKNKCKFHKECKDYDEDCYICNESGGSYYEDEKAGCYRDLEKSGFEP